MKNLVFMTMAFAIGCWAVSKQLEPIENYNG